MKSFETFDSMIAVAFSALVLCLTLSAVSAESLELVSAPRLAGIVSLVERTCVVLDSAGLRDPPGRWWILSEGQEDEGIRVVKIAPDKGSVELVWQWTNNTTVRLNNTTNLPVPGIVLENVSLNAVCGSLRSAQTAPRCAGRIFQRVHSACAPPRKIGLAPPEPLSRRW
jgi:hypothetical protein